MAEQHDAFETLVFRPNNGIGAILGKKIDHQAQGHLGWLVEEERILERSSVIDQPGLTTSKDPQIFGYDRYMESRTPDTGADSAPKTTDANERDVTEAPARHLNHLSLLRPVAAKVGGTTMNVILGLIVTAGALAAWHFLTGTSKSVPEQLKAIFQDAARDHQYAFINRIVDLHGTGTKSYLLVFRNNRIRPGFVASDVSDEMRIYDETDGKLKEQFDFRPLPSTIFRYGFQFDLQNVGAVDNTDRKVILGTYSDVFMNGRIARPVVVVWDEASERYRIYAPLVRPIRLVRKGVPSGYGGSSLYAGETLRDPRTGISLRGAQGAEAFTIRRGGFPLLLAAFVAGAKCHASSVCPPTIELKAWKLDFLAPDPQVEECKRLDGQPILFKVQSFKDLLPAQLNRRWVESTHDSVSCL